MKVKITAKLEISDHDGWCSDGECEYSYSTKKYTIHFPDYKYLGDQTNWCLYLPQPELNMWGSGYCDVSNESVKHDLSKHEYRYTIIKVDIIDQPKDEDYTDEDLKDVENIEDVEDVENVDKA